MSKVGIKDIAELAGVSIATVSHAFRNPGRVSANTLEKVLRVADEVGYTPNNLAVSLRTSRSGNIVVIIPDVSDSFNSGIIKAIEKVAHKRSYSVLLGDSQGSEIREREFANMTLSRQADGIILMSHRIPFDLNRTSTSIDNLPPIVNANELTGYSEIPSISINNAQAAIDATNHLIELGHKDIAVITGNMDTFSSKERLKGFKQAMHEADLDIADDLIVYGEYTCGFGERATQELLMKKKRPTAIFCFCDDLAIGCMFTLRQQGFSVPENISVIGMDNIPVSKYVAPSLTTISQPTELIGSHSATLLLNLIDGIKPAKLQHTLQHKLIHRESTAPPGK